MMYPACASAVSTAAPKMMSIFCWGSRPRSPMRMSGSAGAYKSGIWRDFDW